MFFLPFMDIWLANVPAPEQAMPEVSQPETLPEELNDLQMIVDEVIEIKPFFLEGSVDDFDPIQRAVKIARQLPKKYCGTYKAFDEDLTRKVNLIFSEIQPVGQMIELEGDIIVDKIKTKFTGVWNAKSDQLELIPLTNLSTLDLEEGGSFIGLQGIHLFSWKSSRLDMPGGRLELKQECLEAILNSKAPRIRTVW